MHVPVSLLWDQTQGGETNKLQSTAAIDQRGHTLFILNQSIFQLIDVVLLSCQIILLHFYFCWFLR